ncbi:MAG: hypothetical protein JWM07_5 [Candidatus Saccharibacteria bacterium]|nr:hypothetical protein [Candidatus Saccharibacteria bacterium]
MEDVPYLSDNPDKQSENETRLKSLEKRVKILEEYLRVGVFDEDKQSDYLDSVRTGIDHEDSDQRTSLLALGYLPDRNNDIIPSLVMIDTTEAYWQDTDIYRVKDADRVLTQYEVVENGHPAIYYVPPVAVLRCERYDPDDVAGYPHPVMRIIANNADHALRDVMRSSFFQFDIPTQCAILDDTAEDLHEQLQVEYDTDVLVIIGTREYFCAPADVDLTTIDWNTYRYKASGTVDDPYFQLDGVILNAVYLEKLAREPSKITGSNDLSLGYGLPCIILVNQTHDAIYYIPAASTVSFFSEADNAV